jgi:hypothetical protein
MMVSQANMSVTSQHDSATEQANKRANKAALICTLLQLKTCVKNCKRVQGVHHPSIIFAPIK